MKEKSKAQGESRSKNTPGSPTLCGACVCASMERQLPEGVTVNNQSSLKREEGWALRRKFGVKDMFTCLAIRSSLSPLKDYR